MEAPTLPRIDSGAACLPLEIWLPIFEDTAFFYDSPESENRSKSKLQFVDSRPITRHRIAISHVCRHWRQLCLSTPSFWSYIEISDHACAEEMLRRSGDVDLFVSYRMRSIYEFDARWDLCHQRLADCLPRARIVHINVSQGTKHDIGKVLAESSCPRLKHIFFLADPRLGYSDQQIVIPPTCPKIEALTFCGTALDPSLLYHSLVSNCGISSFPISELILQDVAVLTPASAIFFILTEIRNTVRTFRYAPRRGDTYQNLVPNAIAPTAPIDLPRCEEIFLKTESALVVCKFLSAISTSASIEVEIWEFAPLEELLPTDLGHLAAFESVRSLEFVSLLPVANHIRGFPLTERGHPTRVPTIHIQMPIKWRERPVYSLPHPLRIWKPLVTHLTLSLQVSFTVQVQMWVYYLSSVGGSNALVSLALEGEKNGLEPILRALCPPPQHDMDVSPYAPPLPSPSLRTLTIRTLTEHWDDPSPWTTCLPSRGLLESVLETCEARRADRPDIELDRLSLDCTAEALDESLLQTRLWRAARRIVFLDSADSWLTVFNDIQEI